jgi:hypothetical protein
MPKTETKVTKIECDNPACPGHHLKKNDPAGWLFVTAELYGDPPEQLVYCTYTCAGAGLADDPAARPADA